MMAEFPMGGGTPVMTPAELTARRIKLGLSRSQLAEKFGLHRQTIYLWESNGPVPLWVWWALAGLSREKQRNGSDWGLQAIQLLQELETKLDDWRKTRP